MKEGFVPFSRENEDLDFFPTNFSVGKDGKLSEWEAFTNLCFLVNHSNGFQRIKGKTFPLEPGERICSLRFLAKRWGWSKTKVDNFLKHLLICNCIEIKTIKEDSKKTRFGQLIRVITIHEMSKKGHSKDTRKTVKRHSKDSEKTKKNKAIKEEGNNNINISSFSEEKNGSSTTKKELRERAIQIIDLWNTVCTNLPKKRITENLINQLSQKKYRDYSMEEFEQAFTNVNEDNFYIENQYSIINCLRHIEDKIGKKPENLVLTYTDFINQKKDEEKNEMFMVGKFVGDVIQEAGHVDKRSNIENYCIKHGYIIALTQSREIVYLDDGYRKEGNEIIKKEV